jgi:hypothetical protein
LQHDDTDESERHDWTETWTYGFLKIFNSSPDQ